MTIEIKQLVIRAVIDERRAPDPGAAAPAPPAAPAPSPRLAPPGDAGPDREALIAECTRRVLRELQRRWGR